MELAKLAATAAVTMQLVFWGWLLIERKMLGKLITRPSTPKWVFTALAFSGSLLVVYFARGLVHWGRLDEIGTPMTRRLIVAFFVGSVIVYDLFRVKTKEWSFEGRTPHFWKAKWVAYCLLLPIFLVSVIPVPVIADPVSVEVIHAMARILSLPVVGIIVGVAAVLHTLVSDVVCGVALFVLANQRASRP